MSGSKGMIPYSQELKEQVKKMIQEGKTQKEVAEYFGFKDRFVVHQMLKRERKKEREAAIIPIKRGRTSKNTPETVKQLQLENKRLRMENELMRSFLKELERK